MDKADGDCGGAIAVPDENRCTRSNGMWRCDKASLSGGKGVCEFHSRSLRKKGTRQQDISVTTASTSQPKTEVKVYVKKRKPNTDATATLKASRPKVLFKEIVERHLLPALSGMSLSPSAPIHNKDVEKECGLNSRVSEKRQQSFAPINTPASLVKATAILPVANLITQVPTSAPPEIAVQARPIDVPCPGPIPSIDAKIKSSREEQIPVVQVSNDSLHECSQAQVDHRDTEELPINFDDFNDLDFNFSDATIESVDSHEEPLDSHEEPLDSHEEPLELTRARSTWMHMRECAPEEMCLCAVEFLEVVDILYKYNFFEANLQQYEEVRQTLSRISWTYPVASRSKQDATFKSKELETLDNSWKMSVKELEKEKEKYTQDFDHMNKLSQEGSIIDEAIRIKKRELEELEQKALVVQQEVINYWHLKGKAQQIRETYGKLHKERAKINHFARKVTSARAKGERTQSKIRQCIDECADIQKMYD